MPRQVAILERVIRDYRALGGQVVEHPNWRGHGSSTFSPVDVLNHHIASSAYGYPASLIRNGRPGLAGPLAQCGIERPRDNPLLPALHIIAAGRANHAGSGRLTSNTRAWGVENQGPPFSPSQYRGMVVLTALLNLHGNVPPPRDWDHKEHAPDRKIDRLGIDPAQFRRDVARCMDSPSAWLGIGPKPQTQPTRRRRSKSMYYIIENTPHRYIRHPDGVVTWVPGSGVVGADAQYGAMTTLTQAQHDHLVAHSRAVEAKAKAG